MLKNMLDVGKIIYQYIFQERREIAMGDKTLREAFHDWEELSMTPEQFLAYEARLKHIMDEEAAKREAELQVQEAEKRGEKRGEMRGEKIGEKIGEKKGEKKAKEKIVQRLLAKHAEIPYIMELTDLSKGEILDIQRKMGE